MIECFGFSRQAMAFCGYLGYCCSAMGHFHGVICCVGFDFVRTLIYDGCILIGVAHRVALNRRWLRLPLC